MNQRSLQVKPLLNGRKTRCCRYAAGAAALVFISHGRPATFPAFVFDFCLRYPVSFDLARASVPHFMHWRSRISSVLCPSLSPPARESKRAFTVYRILTPAISYRMCGVFFGKSCKWQMTIKRRINSAARPAGCPTVQLYPFCAYRLGLFSRFGNASIVS